MPKYHVKWREGAEKMGRQAVVYAENEQEVREMAEPIALKGSIQIEELKD